MTCVIIFGICSNEGLLNKGTAFTGLFLTLVLQNCPRCCLLMSRCRMLIPAVSSLHKHARLFPADAGVTLLTKKVKSFLLKSMNNLDYSNIRNNDCKLDWWMNDSWFPSRAVACLALQEAADPCTPRPPLAVLTCSHSASQEQESHLLIARDRYPPRTGYLTFPCTSANRTTS